MLHGLLPLRSVSALLSLARASGRLHTRPSRRRRTGGPLGTPLRRQTPPLYHEERHSNISHPTDYPSAQEPQAPCHVSRIVGRVTHPHRKCHHRHDAECPPASLLTAATRCAFVHDPDAARGIGGFAESDERVRGRAACSADQRGSARWRSCGHRTRYTGGGANDAPDGVLRIRPEH